MDVFDEYALSNAVREELYKCYPQARLAHLKSGGNFPYLSRCSDVNLHVLVSEFSLNFSLRLLNLCVGESYSFLDTSQAVRWITSKFFYISVDRSQAEFILG